MKVGFIASDGRGPALAEVLIDAGHALSIHGRGAAALATPILVEKGAVACASGSDVARRADVVITLLADAAEVEAALFGPGGVAEGLTPGRIVVDMSPLCPVTARGFAWRVGALGCDWLDAPVAGGGVGGAIPAGGTAAAAAAAKPLFDGMGRALLRVGGVGDGQTVRIAREIAAALGGDALGEALRFAALAGADPVRVRAALTGTVPVEDTASLGYVLRLMAGAGESLQPA